MPIISVLYFLLALKYEVPHGMSGCCTVLLYLTAAAVTD